MSPHENTTPCLPIALSSVWLAWSRRASRLFSAFLQLHSKNSVGEVNVTSHTHKCIEYLWCHFAKNKYWWHWKWKYIFIVSITQFCLSDRHQRGYFSFLLHHQVGTPSDPHWKAESSVLFIYTISVLFNTFSRSKFVEVWFSIPTLHLDTCDIDFETIYV